MKVLRIVLLVANGGWLVILVVGVIALLQAGVELALFRAIPLVFSGFVMAGNFAYILRCPPRTKHASDRRLVDTF